MTDTMTLEEYHQLRRENRRRQKFNAQSVEMDGYTFQSGVEAGRWVELKLLRDIGQIANLRPHPRWVLLPGFKHRGKRYREVSYTADFIYEENGIIVVEDVKGGKATQTRDFRMRMKILLYQHPEFDFRIVER